MRSNYGNWRTNIFSVKIATPAFLAILLAAHSAIALADKPSSNYIRVQLGKGTSIEVPKNWEILSSSLRTTLDASVEAKVPTRVESDLAFAANLFDDNRNTLAYVNARFYPKNDISQEDVKSLSAQELEIVGASLKHGMELSASTGGGRFIKWHGVTRRTINNLAMLVHEHTYAAPDGVLIRSRGVRLQRAPRSLTITLAYRERDEALLRPIIDRMTNSIRQE